MHSIEIDKYIAEFYPTTKAKTIAEKFGRSETYIKNRAYQLGIGKKNREEKLATNRIHEKHVWKPKIEIDGAITRHISY